MRTVLYLSSISAVLLGCSPNTESTGDSEPEGSTSLLETACELDLPEGVDPNDGVSFEPEHMPCIELTVDEADWESLGDDSWAGTEEDAWQVAEELAGECGEPWPSEYPWYEANLVADGLLVERVGIRRKGFLGSYFSDRPALKIKTDKYADGQFIGDTERITLNNNAGDSTHLAACLSYEVYALADYPAPLCNLAALWVNGESYGSYTHIEAMKKRFLDRAFGDSTGSFYEGVGTDFIEDWVTRFEAQTDDTDETFEPLLGVAAALRASDEDLVGELDQVVNIERFVTFWALEVLVNHTDAYSSARNNYHVYFDPSDGGRAVLVPWGVDKLPTYDDLPLEDHLYAELARRLSQDDAVRAQMDAELARLATEVWDEEALLASIDHFRAQAETASWDGDTGDVGSQVDALRAWVEERPETITALLADGVPVGEDEAAACLEEDDGGEDKVCPDDFDPSEPCEEGDKCLLGDVWWYCDGGVWMSW
jgi:spore coat protein H